MAHGAGAAMLGDDVTVYMQMGGQPGEPPVLPRTNGAKAAAEALGVKLIEQYSSWQAETMLAQFREALAAKPSCIAIMGHPGNDAFADLVADAIAQGIVVTSGNAPLKELQEKYQDKGFGHAGVDLYEAAPSPRAHAGRRPQIRRQGHGVRQLQPRRPRPLRHRHGRHAGEGGHRRRPRGDVGGGEW
jgi:hypothetical protein